MEKFLPLYSWDLNHVIQLYEYSLHGHVTTIQMQSIDFTQKKIWIIPGNPDIPKPLKIMNWFNMSISCEILTCESSEFWIILWPLNGVENA